MKNNSTRQIPILFSQWKVNEEKGLLFGSSSMILDKWNTLINGKLSYQNSGIELLDADEIQTAINESEDDQQTVRSMLIWDLVDKPNIKDKEEYVKVNQALLIRILDKLFSYTQTKQQNETLLLLYNAISQHLQSTLDFIEDFFGNYFDRTEKIPEPYLTIAKANISKQIKRLKNILSKQESVDINLINLIYESIHRLLNDESVVITYNLYAYHKTLLNELLTQRVPSTQDIIEVLYFLNYNEDNFITYEYDWLKQSIDNLPSNKEKITALRFEQKKINQLSLKLNCCYNTNMPSLKDQMNGWIDEEVKFLENSHLLDKPTAAENESKIHTTLSVAKLALLLRLLVIDKIIINRTVAPMLRVAAKIFTTLQREDISFGSMETKYHAPDKATINAVKDMLFKWINILGRL